MEPTSSPDNARQSRGLARFWPVHGMPAPAQRHSDEDPDDVQDDDQQVSGPPAVSHSGSAQAAAAAQLAAQNAGTGQDALTSDTQMVALGSRRGFEANGARGWTGNQGGAFPPVDSERGPHNGDQAPRHGGGPVPNGQPGSRPPFGPSAPADAPAPPAGQALPLSGATSLPGATPPSMADQLAPRPPFTAQNAPTSGAPAPFRPASPFGPPPQTGGQAGGSPQANGSPPPAPRPPGRPDETPRGAASVPPGSRRHTADDEEADEAADRAEQAQGRAATGWASVPTSGIPTLSGGAPTGTTTNGAAPTGSPESGGSPVGRPPIGSATHGPAFGSASHSQTTGSAAHGRTSGGGSPATGSQIGEDRANGSRADSGFARTSGPDDRSSSPATGGQSRGTVTSSSTATTGTAGPDRGTEQSSPAGDAAADPEPREREEPEAPGTAPGSRPAIAMPSAVPEQSAAPVSGAGAGDELQIQSTTAGPRRLASLADADAALPRAGRRSAEPAPAPDGPLRPGDVNLSQIAFWDEEAITHFRSKWHEVKADFVDDPETALTRAHDLLTDAVNELTEALLAERDELDPMRTTSTPDTESMRMAMRGYREFLDRILAL